LWFIADKRITGPFEYTVNRSTNRREVLTSNPAVGLTLLHLVSRKSHHRNSQFVFVQTTHSVHMEKFNLKKLNEVEVKEQYRVEISNSFEFWKTYILRWGPRGSVVVRALCYKPEGPEEVIGFFQLT
jgi:hypothetical protein